MDVKQLGKFGEMDKLPTQLILPCHLLDMLLVGIDGGNN